MPPKSNLFAANDPFWDSYNSLPESYRKQVDPYLNYSYHDSFWDGIGNVLGFNTAADRYKMQMQDRARQALAGIIQDQFQNEYNSAPAQASRQRDAGLNPDLAGQTDGAPASGLEQPMSPIDPSIFGPAPEELFVDIASLFGSAASGLASVGQFVNLLAQKRKTESETTATQISNADEAWDYAGKYLSAFDPSTRLDFGDVEFTPDFFNQKILPSKIESLRTKAPGLSDEAYNMIEKAMKARSTDPSIMDAYYKAYSAASKSKFERIADKSVYGALDLADEVISMQNKTYLDYRMEAIKLTIHYNKIVADYNKAREQNNFDFETWKAKKNIPENLAEANLQTYLSDQAKGAADALRAQKTKDWIDYLWGLKDKSDPAGIYLLNAMLQGGYAPLMNTSVNAGFGPFKGGGSWQNYIVPGMKTPQDGFTRSVQSTHDPNNPFSWQDQKY